MDAIKEGKSVTQIVTDVGAQELPKMDKVNTEQALIKLSEKVLQMKGSTDIVLLEDLVGIDDDKNVGMSAFIDTIEKTSLSCFEAVSLLEADDLNTERAFQSTKAVEKLNESLNPFKITETLDESQSKELVIEKQPKTRAISINQSGEKVQSMVKAIHFQFKLIDQ